MSDLRATAIRLLARREHSAAELRHKLASRTRADDDDEAVDPAEAIDALIGELQREGLQSDHRFAESYTRMRFNKGYGPVRIDNELRERGVSESIRRQCIEEMAGEWWPLMQKVREKKFGQALPGDYAERTRQMRFLQYRGFAGELIRELFS